MCELDLIFHVDKVDCFINIKNEFYIVLNCLSPILLISFSGDLWFCVLYATLVKLAMLTQNSSILYSQDLS